MAIDFSGFDGVYGFGFACRLNAPRYKPASARTESTVMPPMISVFLFNLLLGVTLVLAGAGASCRRCATSAADCGRCGGSFARHAATVSSQTCGTDAGSMSNSLRRSASEGATRSQICQSMFPE